MRIFIKTDANEIIGYGHLQRCLNLAEILKKNHEIIFLFCSTPNLILKEVKKKFKIIRFKDNKSILQKVKKFHNKKNLNFLILDDYSVNYDWEKTISIYFSKVLVIGDHLDRKHYCNFYLNQNVIDKKTKKDLSKKFSTAKCLLGPKYALLDKNYLKYSNKKKKRTSLKNIIISFGGSDRENLTAKTLDVLSQNKFSKFNIKVAIGKNYKYFNELVKKHKTNKKIIFFKGLSSLANTNYNSDLSIGAGGITTWERLCLSLPSLVFQVSNNQKVTIDNLKKKKVIVYAGKEKDFNKNRFEILIKFLIKKYKKITQNMEYGKVLVDGRGPMRVSEILFPTIGLKTFTRKAKKEDLYDYYNWVNDEEVRENSFNSKKINFESHKKWFFNQLKFSKKNFLYVFGTKKFLLGQTRINLSNKIARIDYSIDKDFRNRGLGKKMLEQVIKKKALSNLYIFAEVKTLNKASINIFKNLNFNVLQQRNKIIFSKK